VTQPDPVTQKPVATPDGRGVLGFIEEMPSADCANCGHGLVKQDRIWVHYATDERPCDA